MARLILPLLMVLCAWPAMGAVIVQLDYRFDSTGFFNNASARAALEAGINNVASHLLDTLDPIAPGPTPFGFSNKFDATIKNPSTGLDATVTDLFVPQDTLIVFVGARDLPAGVLGNGGPGGNSTSGLSDFVDGVFHRGEGETKGAAAVDFAPWGGAIAFDNVVNWSFDTSLSDPGGGLNSFITVVEHEFGHLLGFGTSDSWKNQTATIGGSLVFTGDESVKEYGSNVPLANIAHWADGLQSLVNGVPQEVVLGPSVTVGDRKEFTSLDYAGLSDIGWELDNVPESSSLLLVGVSSIGLMALIRRRLHR